MDRSYDSEEIHRIIREDLNADSIIPIRSWKYEIIGITYRQGIVLRADDPKYRKRQLIENIFSVLKRRFNGDLKTRKFKVHIKEIPNKMISSLSFSSEQNYFNSIQD